MAIDPRSLDFGREKPFCVYIYRDPRRGNLPIYVGAGKRNRPDTHWRQGSHNPELNRILGEIKAAGLEPIYEYVEFFDYEKEAAFLENALIAQIGHKDLALGPLTNCTGGLKSKPRVTDAHRAAFKASREALAANGAKLKACREMLGWSRWELSRRAKVCVQTVIKAEETGAVLVSVNAKIWNAMKEGVALYEYAKSVREYVRSVRDYARSLPTRERDFLMAVLTQIDENGSS